MTERTLVEWRDQYRNELVEIDAIRMAEDTGAHVATTDMSIGCSRHTSPYDRPQRGVP